MILEFTGDNFFLSNFYTTPVAWEGITYPSAEHAFNAAKTLDHFARREILFAPTPNEAKRLGRRVSLRPEWDERVRYDSMQSILVAKFQEPTLRDALLETQGETLVEGNWWHDTHWGVCNCDRHRGRGDNYLGMMLMNLRNYLNTRPTRSAGD